MDLKAGDQTALIRLRSGRQQTGPSEKGPMRPDARDLYNNAGNSLANPYNGTYPWVTPPQAATQISRRGTIAAPAYGVQALITSFQVPQAMEAVITHIICKFDGSGFVQASGAVIWTIDINRPLGAASQGYNPPDFGSIITQLGDFLTFPFPVPGGIRLSERDTIRFKVTTANPVGIGAPNYITAMALGWYYPVKLAFPIQNFGG
jgi:hypothetical protein